MSSALADSRPRSSSTSFAPSLSASSFGPPTTAFQEQEETRKKERTLSGESGRDSNIPGGFDPTKAFGERRGSRTGSAGSAGGGGGEGGGARDEVRREAGERKEKMGAVLEEGASSESHLII